MAETDTGRAWRRFARGPACVRPRCEDWRYVQLHDRSTNGAAHSLCGPADRLELILEIDIDVRENPEHDVLVVGSLLR
jgi:hypothetical protein